MIQFIFYNYPDIRFFRKNLLINIFLIQSIVVMIFYKIHSSVEFYAYFQGGLMFKKR